MQGLATREGPSRAVRIALEELDADLRSDHPVLSAPLTIPWSETLMLALDGDVPWVFGRADRDPLRGRRGTNVLPRRARRQLTRIAASGVQFQRIAIAHELDPAGPYGIGFSNSPPDRCPAPRRKPDSWSERFYPIPW